LLAHEAEVYAGFLEQTDYEVGRLLEAIKDEGKADNTVVLTIIGDNGASAEGGLEGTDARDISGNKKTIEDRENVYDLLGSELYYNHYAASWAWGLNSPFVGTKQDASHLGGTTDPLIITWPGHIKDVGEVRSQFSHVNDIAATIYELTGAKFPDAVDGVKQISLEGKSLVYTFDNANAPTRHTLQYFTTSGNRAIFKDGWWAGDRFQWTWETTYGLSGPGRDDKSIDVRPWELYNLNEDFSQAHDLAAKYPEKLKELIKTFDEEAERNHAYPILPGRKLNPVSPAASQTVFTYRSGVDRLNSNAAPSLTGRPYTISTDVEIPVGEKASGVILAQGGELGGISLFVKENVVYFEINAYAARSGQLVASGPLTPGKSHLELTVTPSVTNGAPDIAFTSRKSSEGDAVLKVNGLAAGQAHFANVNVSPGETLDIGSDLGSPVSSEYKSPNRFTGKIDLVTVELK
jgi:arylsulfatase